MFSVEPSVPASVSELLTPSVFPPVTVTGLPVRSAKGSVKFVAVSAPLTVRFVALSEPTVALAAVRLDAPTFVAFTAAAFVTLCPPALRSACIAPCGVKFSIGALPAPQSSSTDASASPPSPAAVAPRRRYLEFRLCVIVVG